MKEIYILGAGFSKWFSDNMPLLKDLPRLFSDSLFDEIMDDKVLNMFIRKDKNIEKLLSYLSVNYPWKTKPEMYSNNSLYLRIIQEISNEIIIAQRKIDYNINKSDVRYKIFSYWYKNKSTIITFNYDNIIEQTFSTINKYQDWYLFYKMPIKNLSDRSKPTIFNGSVCGVSDDISEVPTILKLHGSVSWLFNGNFMDQEDENVYHYNPFIELTSNEINKKGLSEYIIPPSLEKNNYINHNLMKCLWQTAKTEVYTADEIIFIGYSFPQSDIYMDLFLKSSINQQQKITVVDNNATQVFQDRIKKIFYPMNSQGVRFITGDTSVNDFIQAKGINA